MLTSAEKRKARIVSLLINGNKKWTDLKDLTNSAKGTLHKDLKSLENENLISKSKEGNSTVYSLNLEKIYDYHYLKEYSDHFAPKLSRIQDILRWWEEKESVKQGELVKHVKEYSEFYGVEPTEGFTFEEISEVVSKLDDFLEGFSSEVSVSNFELALSNITEARESTNYHYKRAVDLEEKFNK